MPRDRRTPGRGRPRHRLRALNACRPCAAGHGAGSSTRPHRGSGAAPAAPARVDEHVAGEAEAVQAGDGVADAENRGGHTVGKGLFGAIRPLSAPVLPERASRPGSRRDRRASRATAPRGDEGPGAGQLLQRQSAATAIFRLWHQAPWALSWRPRRAAETDRRRRVPRPVGPRQTPPAPGQRRIGRRDQRAHCQMNRSGRGALSALCKSSSHDMRQTGDAGVATIVLDSYRSCVCPSSTGPSRPRHPAPARASSSHASHARSTRTAGKSARTSAAEP